MLDQYYRVTAIVDSLPSQRTQNQDSWRLGQLQQVAKGNQHPRLMLLLRYSIVHKGQCEEDLAPDRASYPAKLMLKTKCKEFILISMWNVI